MDPEKFFKALIISSVILFFGGCVGQGTLTTINRELDESRLNELPFPVSIGCTWELP